MTTNNAPHEKSTNGKNATTPPEGVYADSEIFNYQFRVSAGNYLMGNIEAKGQSQDRPEPVKISIPKRKKKAKTGDEGC